ncbi:MAG: hypothetical protein NTV46_20635 [Verrucomicrobia bacterium]|nr:hypothetical protein [Verrucomicrobiota bacterium]
MPVNVPFLPAKVSIKSAMQEISPGLFEYRFLATNEGTPKATANIPIGMNDQLTRIDVSAGIEATTNELSTTISTSTGGLNLHQTALFMVLTTQNKNSQLYARLTAGSYNSNQGVIVPGEAIPKPALTFFNNGLHLVYFAKPGTPFIPQDSNNLQAWNSATGNYKIITLEMLQNQPIDISDAIPWNMGNNEKVMPINGAYIYYRSPNLESRFARFKSTFPDVTQDMTLFDIPLESQTPRLIDGVLVFPGVTVLRFGNLGPPVLQGAN